MTDNTGIVEIHGREYKTVARRIADFRSMDKYADYRLETEILNAADLVLIQARVLNHDGTVIATGHAEEARGATSINKTSAIENAETSAVGRALAFLDGDLAGTEIASADEIAEALQQQKELEQVERLKNHMKAVKDHWSSIVAIREALADLNDTMPDEERAARFDRAFEAYEEIPNEDRVPLALAPTKGGVWETWEYAALKSNDFSAARKRYYGHSEDKA